MMDRRSVIAGLLAVLCTVGGFQLLGRGDAASISSGILLLVVGLGAAAVALGGRPYGPEWEGNLDLSTRIAMGLLGGVLAGLAHGVLTWMVGSPAFRVLVSGGFETHLGAEGWSMRVVLGALWGLIFGVLYVGLPGRDFVRRGLAFSVLPTLLTLLFVYPVQLGAGLMGFRLGPLVWTLVAAGNAVAGIVAAAVMEWANRTWVAPVSRPLVD